MHPELSVIIPMYDEEQVLPLLVDRLRPVLDRLDGTYEVVAVDDGSRDQTPVLLQRYRHQWPELRVLRLRANSGHQAAISAGLAAARGDWVVPYYDQELRLKKPPLNYWLTGAVGAELTNASTASRQRSRSWASSYTNTGVP